MFKYQHENEVVKPSYFKILSLRCDNSILKNNSNIKLILFR